MRDGHPLPTLCSIAGFRFAQNATFEQPERRIIIARKPILQKSSHKQTGMSYCIPLMVRISYSVSQ